MMPRKTGGRKKVTANELKKLIAQLQASGDKTQLDLTLEIMRNESYSPKIRFKAAKAALPFCHRPKDKEPATEDDDAA